MTREEGLGAAQRVRPFEAGDEAAINRGFNRAFHLERPLEEWRWKFSNDSSSRRIRLGIDEAGEIVAHYAALPVRAWFGETRCWFGQIVDVYSLHRSSLARKGLFQETVACFFAELCGPGGLAALYGFPSDRAMRLGVATLGYPEGRPVRQWMASPDRVRAGRADRALWIARGFDADAIDRLWARAARRYRAGRVRDARAVQPRYSGRRGVDYQQLLVSRLGEPRAWGVVRIEGARARWVDLVWDGRDPRDLEALAGEVAAEARRAGTREIELWMQGDRRSAEVLAGLGFADRDHPEVWLAALSFDPAIPQERLASELYLTLGDSDLV